MFLEEYFFKDKRSEWLNEGNNMLNILSDDSNDSENDVQQKKFTSDGKNTILLHPDSTIRAIWDLSLFACIIYQSISLPMRISFEIATDDFSFYLETIIDSMFIIDVFLNFNTGFYDVSTIITDRYEIAKDYMKFWFWIDLISSIPYTWIFAATQGISLKMIESDDALSELGLSSNVANAP
jgi:hypothetical protein